MEYPRLSIGGGRDAKFEVDEPISFVHSVTNPKEDYTRKKSYLSVSWPGLRITGPSAVSSQWKFSNVVLFVILEPFHSAPLLSLY